MSEAPVPVLALRKIWHNKLPRHTLTQSEIDDDVLSSLLSDDAVSILVGGSGNVLSVRRGHGLWEWEVWRGDTSASHIISARRGECGVR